MYVYVFVCVYRHILSQEKFNGILMLDDLFFHPLVNDDDKIVICDHTKRQRAKTVNLRFSVLLSSAGIYLLYSRRVKKVDGNTR